MGGSSAAQLCPAVECEGAARRRRVTVVAVSVSEAAHWWFHPAKIEEENRGSE